MVRCMSESRSLHSATISSEDELFRRLRRGTFEEACIAWNRVIDNGFTVDVAVEALRAVGWTKDEFYRASTKNTGFD